MDCGTCIKMPGCQHGICKEVDGNDQPLTCDCEDGWKGALCDIRECAKGSLVLKAVVYEIGYIFS